MPKISFMGDTIQQLIAKLETYDHVAISGHDWFWSDEDQKWTGSDPDFELTAEKTIEEMVPLMWNSHYKFMEA